MPTLQGLGTFSLQTSRILIDNKHKLIPGCRRQSFYCRVHVPNPDRMSPPETKALPKDQNFGCQYLKPTLPLAYVNTHRPCQRKRARI